MDDIRPLASAGNGDDDPFAIDDQTDPFALKDDEEFRAAAERDLHVFRGHTCDTERRGRTRTPLELVVDATNGFIPLWCENALLRWRFQERSLIRYRNPEAVKAQIRTLLHGAIAAWGDAVPVRFTEDRDAWDFEIAVRDSNQCSPMGCTLASAFFPDQGQHELVIYPMMFDLDPAERLETMAHEIGHIFGLRHFFALTDETRWQAEIFGVHEDVSIMNYGDESRLTDADRSDLRRLYQLAWSGELTNINRTPIRLVTPFSSRRP
jgi:hypothetical protein